MEKYLKYKNKYLNLKNKISLLKNGLTGGLIGQIPRSKLDEMKSNDEIPEIIKDYIKMMTIKGTKIIRVGSSMNKIQPYYSDIDVMDIVDIQKSTQEAVMFFIENLKILLININRNSNVFFSDFKAGGLHWTIDQIMNEKNGELSLFDAFCLKAVIKLDIIAQYDERYLEMSTFFILKSVSEYINVEKNYFENFQKSLLVDIEHYKVNNPFKAIKRVWSLAKLNKDEITLEILYEIIKSNVALIAQINSDIETLILLIQHNSKFDLKFVLKELDGFRERLSSILDITLDSEKINLIIDKIKLLFILSNLNNEVNVNVIDSLNQLHDYLLNSVNNETFEYLKSKNYKFPTMNDSSNNVKEFKDNNIESIEL